MNYQKLYNNIIDNRKKNEYNGYTEKHHIVPRSLGGTDEESNLVDLSAREHFLCHYLLAKMYQKETFEWYKMNHAFMMMKMESYNQQRYFNSRLYEALKSNFSSLMSIAQSGKNNSQHGTMWICNVELEQNKKIPKTEDIPEGWVKGRNKWKTKQREYNSHIKIWKRELKNKTEAEHYWNLFVNGNYSSPFEFSKKVYPKSNVMLHKLWKKYIIEYIENSRQGKPFSRR